MQPRDFLSDSESSEPVTESLPGRDFLMEDQPKESFGEALIKSPFRVKEDIYRAGGNFLKSIPEYYQQAKTEIPGFINPPSYQIPHMAMQSLAGANELINSLSQFPKETAEYLSNRLHLLPQSVTEAISKITPEDTSQAIHELFGEPEFPGESLIRGATRNAMNIYGLGKIIPKLNPLKLTSKNIAKDILETRDANKNIYSNLYNNVWNEAKEHGIDDLSHVLPKIDIPTISKYSPQKYLEGIENFSENPNLENAHQAKSDLLSLKRKMDKSSTFTSGERKQYKAVNNAINSLQNNMFKDKTGLVNNALLDKYNLIQKGYANEVIPYTTNKFINKFRKNEISPNELIKSISKGEFMAKRGKFHPEIGLRKKIVPGFAGVGAAGAAKFLYDNLMGPHTLTSNENSP